MYETLINYFYGMCAVTALAGAVLTYHFAVLVIKYRRHKKTSA